MSDSAIPLSFRPPQVNDPLETYGKVMSIGQMMQQRQINAERLRGDQLENQQRQRNIAGDQALADLMKQHTTLGDNGQASVDHDAIEQGLASKGFGERALKYGVDRRAQVKAALDQHEKELQFHEAQNKVVMNGLAPVVSALNPVPSADPNEAPVPIDPQALESSYQQGRRQAIAAGINPDQHGAPQTLLARDMTLDPQALAWVKNAHAQAVGAQGLIDEQRKRTQFANDVIAARDAHAKHQITTANDYLAYGSRILGSATDPSTYAIGRSELEKMGAPAEVMNQFDQGWSPSGVTRAQNLGMTAEQREANRMRQEGISNQEEYRNAMLGLRQDSLDFRREMAQRVREQTATSKATDNRLSRRELDSAAKEEDELHEARIKMGGAIGRLLSAAKAANALDADGRIKPGATLDASGLTYVDKKGATKPMKAVAKDEGSDVVGLGNAMIDNYNALTNSLKRVIGSKYDAAGRLGAAPTVPLSDVIDKIDKGDAVLFSAGRPKAAVPAPGSVPVAAPPQTPPPAAAPQAPAQPPPVAAPKPGSQPGPGKAGASPKTVSKSDVQKFATQYGVSYSKAAAHFNDSGYAIQP